MPVADHSPFLLARTVLPLRHLRDAIAVTPVGVSRRGRDPQPARIGIAMAHVDHPWCRFLLGSRRGTGAAGAHEKDC